MAENTEKLTLRELEKQMTEMREAYEEKLAALESRMRESSAPARAEKSTVKKKKSASDWLCEEVPVRLFKDGEKYRDDLTLGINGTLVKIRRGETVMMKRKYLLLINQSMIQDEKTADMMNRESKRFDAESHAYTA